MDDLEDLDAFIANIEQSAPVEVIDPTDLRCQQCDTSLEDIDGDYICPNCNTKATDILQLEESEVTQIDGGRVLLGQRVRIKDEKNDIHDYGWAWSTDEAIVQILNAQLKALEKCGLINDLFIQGVKTMWTKFWLENIAPAIRDSYDESEMIPLSIAKNLKFRDIEVLVKVHDKVIVAGTRRPRGQKTTNRPRNYKMMSVNFTKTLTSNTTPSNENVNHQNSHVASSENSSDSSISDIECSDPADRSLVISSEEQNSRSASRADLLAEPIEDSSMESNVVRMEDEDSTGESEGIDRTTSQVQTSRDKIAILTLDRTLAFIEATARALNMAEPIFAADIVRACNHRIIPFFGAHKILPEGMRLNSLDKLMFQKTRPPTPNALTRSASRLLTKIYHDQLPAMIPVPSIERIFERFIYDMNLPHDLLNHIKNQIRFSTFKQTRPLLLQDKNSRTVIIPQYDRWAFVILVSQLKRMFDLTENGLQEHEARVESESSRTGQKIFSMKKWTEQMSAKLKLIFRYDPFVLFHPMTDVKELQLTPPISQYVESLLSDRATCQVRARPNLISFDSDFRNELSEFLDKEMPRPPNTPRSRRYEYIERPVDVKHPIRDAFIRTKPLWFQDVSKNNEIKKTLFRDFYSDKLILPQQVKNWSIYDGQPDAILHCLRMKILKQWPYCFKLLLSVGGYLCYCEPRELLIQLRSVEEYMYPSIRVDRREKRMRFRQSTIPSFEAETMMDCE